jgi:PKD repeat protein
LRDVPHTFLTAGTYLVKMTASNSLGSDAEWMSVTVTTAEDVDFSADVTNITAGETVTFTDSSSAGGSNPTWTFGAGEGGGTGSTATHTYDTPGTYEVSLTVTYASGDKTLTRPAYITVDVATCNVPSFNGIKRSNAAARWLAFGFSGTVSDGPNPPNGNYTINTQSITALTDVPCNSNILVNRQ